MRFRKLRIAWSILDGLVWTCVLFLFARSFWWADSIDIPILAGSPLQIGSVQGTVGIVVEYPPEVASGSTSRWNHFQSPTDEVKSELAKSNESLPSPIYGGLRKIQRLVVFFVPDWLVLVLVTMDQVRWRFSLRTLLIAITLVAVVLGLAFYLVRTH
jgi:hypothetical protein